MAWLGEVVGEVTLERRGEIFAQGQYYKVNLKRALLVLAW